MLVFLGKTLTLESSLFSFSSLFSICGFPCFFCAFLLSFPRISRVLQRGKSSLFSGDAGGSSLFCQKKNEDWRVREETGKRYRN